MADEFPLEDIITVVGAGGTQRAQVVTGRTQNREAPRGGGDAWETTVSLVAPDGVRTPRPALHRSYPSSAEARAGHVQVVEQINARGIWVQ